jgi:hypothetical protein
MWPVRDSCGEGDVGIEATILCFKVLFQGRTEKNRSTSGKVKIPRKKIVILTSRRKTITT